MKLILFDLGGVLIELKGMPFKKEWIDSEIHLFNNYWIDSKSAKNFESGKSTAEEFASEIKNELNLDVPDKQFLEYFTNWPGGYFQNTESMLLSLKEKYTIACLSNSNELHWKRAISEWKVHDYFDYAFASHLIGEVKPNSKTFEHVIEITGFLPENIIFFDDNIKNIKAAMSLGIESHHVNNIHSIKEILQIKL